MVRVGGQRESPANLGQEVTQARNPPEDIVTEGRPLCASPLQLGRWMVSGRTHAIVMAPEKMKPASQPEEFAVAGNEQPQENAPAKKKVLLVDDHVVIRQGLRHLIDAENDMMVVSEASDGREALEKVAHYLPDVAVLDVTMKEISGPAAARQIQKISPQTKILGLTMHEDSSYVREMMEAGAMGYVLKRAASEELIRAIRAVSVGGTYVDPRVAGKLLISLVSNRRGGEDSAVLSERENDVLRLIAQGFTNKEIAAKLAISVKTVETYKSRGMDKLELRSRVDIIRSAVARGWLTGK